MSTSATPSINRAAVDAAPFNKFLELGGRILLASLFLLSGLSKISGYVRIPAIVTGYSART